jgi:uncharacterized protein YhaN
MYKILDYYRQHPNASAVEVVSYFEEEFDISTQVEIIKQEAVRAHQLRSQLRPLYGQRLEVDEKTKYVLSDIEMEVYLAYPPRQGSEAQREAKRNEMKRINVEFIELHADFRGIANKIDALEDDYKEIEHKAKNARRLTELFGQYVAFITEYSKGR